MNHSEWAAAYHSYNLSEKTFQFGEKLPIPTRLPDPLGFESPKKSNL